MLTGNSISPFLRNKRPDSGPPRLLIQDFAIIDSGVDWQDEVPPEPVDTYLGPINIVISELNTLPDRAGLQDVIITTETQGTLSWNGSLELSRDPTFH
jgi:hypothetical protein